MTTYTNIFGGSAISSTETSYRAVTLTGNVTLSWPTELATSSDVTADIMDVTCLSAGAVIRMPPANLVGVGYAVLFNNVSSDSFLVANNSGTTICTVAAGQQWMVYVRDNSTVNGLWRAYQFGAATTTASASSLAGAGLKAISSLLTQAIPIFTFSGAYTAGSNDRASALVWTGGSGTLGLPIASAVGADWFVHVKNNGTGALSITPTTSTIDGGATISLNPTESTMVVSDGTNYFTVGLGRSAAFAFTYLSINVAGTGTYTLSTVEQNKTAYRFTGLLTGNREVIVPATLQQYWCDNSTTGAFTLTVKTAAGSGVVIPAGQRSILYCDGTNVVDADTNGISTPVAIADGGTGATTASAARTNLGATSVGNSLFTATDAAAARSAISAVATGSTITTSGLFSMATARLLGRSTAGSGDIEAITVGSGLLLSGNTLSSTAGGGSVTSVGMTVPAFLSVSGSPITGAGTLAVTLSGTALPVANGGTGATAATGTGNVVLATAPTLTNATLTTPTVTVRDNALTITDQTDTTKIGVFELSGLTTGTTRTLTWPNASGTIALTATTITAGTGLTGGGDLSANRTISVAAGGISATELASNAVTTAKIADSNVTTAKIADANVTTVKIADANVTTVKIADANVTTAKIADDAVTNAKIAFDGGSLSGFRNRLINGGFNVNQRGDGTTNDDVYCFDRWYSLTQTGLIDMSTLTDPADGIQFCGRLTQSQVSAQRFGLAQIIESINCKDLRGKTISLSCRVRCSAATNIRIAVIEWTNTANVVTSDIVNNWTSTTYTPGNFFVSTGFNNAGTGSVSVSANTWTDLVYPTGGSTHTVSSTANNLIVFIWTESAQAQNVTLDFANVQLEQGNVPTSFERRLWPVEFLFCARYYYNCATSHAHYVPAPGATYASGYPVFLPSYMFTTPTITPSYSSSNAVQSYTTALYAGPHHFVHYVVASTSTNAYMIFTYTATAEM